jgi:hypothetical protein
MMSPSGHNVQASLSDRSQRVVKKRPESDDEEDLLRFLKGGLGAK